MLFRKRILFTLFYLISFKIFAQVNDSLLQSQQFSKVNNTVDEKVSFQSNIFIDYWNNKNIFPYTYPLKAFIPDSVPITLVDSTHTFMMPTLGRLSSEFGPRDGIIHKGLDIYLRKGDNVLAAFDGKVRYAQFNTGNNTTIISLCKLNKLSPKAKLKIGQSLRVK